MNWGTLRTDSFSMHRLRLVIQSLAPVYPILSPPRPPKGLALQGVRFRCTMVHVRQLAEYTLIAG